MYFRKICRFAKDIEVAKEGIVQAEKNKIDQNEVEKREPFVERVAEAPAKVLEKTVKSTEAVIEGTGKVIKKVSEQKPIQKAKDFWHILGPGLTTGAADDDPSGIATYSQTGAKYGFGLLWLAAFTFPLMAVVQEMCARIGLTTGRGLAANIRIHFPRWVLIVCTVLLFVANTFNLGADLGSMAEATRLLVPQIDFTWLVIGFTVLCLFLQIFTTYKKYAKYLKWLALVLFSYVLAAVLIPNLNWHEILLAAIKPSIDFSKDQMILICGILGTTISPYLFFWQTSQEVEEGEAVGENTIKARQDAVTDHDIADMRTDIWSGMFLSNAAFFFIVLACGATLNRVGITNINTAAQAAEALRPLAGDQSYLLFTIGILGVGLLGVPILAGSAAYAISEAFGWTQGLNKKLNRAYAFYGVIIISTLIGLSLNFIGLDPIKALIYAAVANGLVAPVILVLIVLISGSKKVMGERVNGSWTKTVGWIATIFMVVAGLATIYSFFP